MMQAAVETGPLSKTPQITTLAIGAAMLSDVAVARTAAKALCDKAKAGHDAVGMIESI
ncbi:MAG: hypothetical protein KGJ62_02870 [Armatimonadetes bacterium]|nr:hypothetical protein [Armatimonadota bacterium]MDE2205612.1 hypothetical protein [Armatimonadota bacterium]